MKISKFALIALTLFTISLPIKAAVVITVSSARLNDQSGNTLANNSLLQLINLGADGVFNPINIGDGSNTGLNRWVSGDDQVFDVTMNGADFASTRAFDLLVGTDGGDGVLSRVMDFTTAGFPDGAKLGLRWFPGLLATNFDTITSANGLASGQRYGQFTRQTSPLNGGDIWVTTAADGNYTFDPLITDNFSSPGENNTLGNASLIVVPEPSSAFLALLGITSLLGVRRRK